MNRTWEIIRGILFLAGIVAGVGWIVVRSVQKAEDPARMIFKWVLTGGGLFFMFWKVAPIVGQGGYGGGFWGISLGGGGGRGPAIIWRQHIVSLLAKTLASPFHCGGIAPRA